MDVLLDVLTVMVMAAAIVVIPVFTVKIVEFAFWAERKIHRVITGRDR